MAIRDHNQQQPGAPVDPLDEDDREAHDERERDRRDRREGGEAHERREQDAETAQVPRGEHEPDAGRPRATNGGSSSGTHSTVRGKKPSATPRGRPGRHDLPEGTRRGASDSNPGDRQMESGRTTASPEERTAPRSGRPAA